MLRCKNIVVRFGGLVAVNNVDLHVTEGGITGIIGPNGAGKTTLFNVICGFARTVKGSIIYKDQEIKNLAVDARVRLGIGRTFQIPQPFERLTVKENSVIGALYYKRNLQEALGVSDEILELLEIADIADCYPGQLPIGLRKKLELAKALSTNPQLLLLDEIMGGLHPNEVNEMCQIVRKINKRGLTVLLIEHVIGAAVSLCDRIVVMDQGRIIADGSPDQVMADEKVVDAYLGRNEIA